MNDMEKEIRDVDRQAAENEARRQTVSAVRVSSWAVILALITFSIFGMFLMMVIRL